MVKIRKPAMTPDPMNSFFDAVMFVVMFISLTSPSPSPTSMLDPFAEIVKLESVNCFCKRPPP